MSKTKKDTNPKHNKKRHLDGSESAFEKEARRIERSNIQSVNDYKKVGEKTDGVSAGGIYSKTFTDAGGETKTKLYMLKAMDPYSMASEYVGANMARLYIGDSAPIVELVRGKNGEVFVASEFIDDFQTLKSISKQMGLPKECFPYGCVVDGNGKLQPTAPHLQKILDSQKVKYPQINDAELANIVVQYLQHGDPHDRNVGLRRIGIDKYSTSLIDWSWSLRGSEPDRAVSERNYNPNYAHLPEYNPENTLAAIDAVLKISPEEMANVTQPLFNNLAQVYGKENAVFKEQVAPDSALISVGIGRLTDKLESLTGINFSARKTLPEVQNAMISSLEKRAKILEQERIAITSNYPQLQLPHQSAWESNNTGTFLGATPTLLIDNQSNLRACFQT
jgi:hypothetical protein